MLTAPLEIVNLNGTLRKYCSIFYNDHPLTNKEDDDEKLLEEISLLSTSSSPGSHHTNVDDRMVLTMAEDLDHGSDFGISPVFLLFNPVQLDTFWT